MRNDQTRRSEGWIGVSGGELLREVKNVAGELHGSEGPVQNPAQSTQLDLTNIPGTRLSQGYEMCSSQRGHGDTAVPSGGLHKLPEPRPLKKSPNVTEYSGDAPAVLIPSCAPSFPKTSGATLATVVLPQEAVELLSPTDHLQALTAATWPILI